MRPNVLSINNTTYLRLAPGASIGTIRAEMPGIAKAQFSQTPPGLTYDISLVRLDELRLFPGLNPGGRARVMTLAAIGLLTLIVASINFINLATARPSRRAREIAIRKTAGASREALIVQFLGVTLLYVRLASCVGVALTELLLPWVNTFLQTGATFDYLHDPLLLGWLTVGVIVLAVLAGMYPALVLTAFRPASVLKGVVTQVGGANVARQVLVTLQFAVLIAMLVCASIVYQQRSYALNDALQGVTDQHVLVETRCTPAMDRRTKEIGIRKAMGAGEREIVWLLVRQFTKPVAWAAVIAWPVSAYLMGKWLEGFAYHVDLTFTPFLGATAVALVVALFTVGVHSLSRGESQAGGGAST